MARRDAWAEKLLDAIAAEPRVLIVLDFDGTLVATRALPRLARLVAKERAILRRLNRGGFRLAIISGRSVGDLRACVGVPELIYGGVFGLEISGPGLRFVHSKARAMRRALFSLVEGLRNLLADVPGVLIEDKAVGLAVHYRSVPADRRKEFSRRLSHARAAAPSGLRWRRGRLAWEVIPKTGWDKGDAALLLWRRLGRPYLLVVGDGRFDEPMLRAAHERGAGLRVGRGSSEARFRLRDSNAVRRFLSGLAERAGSRSASEASSGRGSGRRARRPGRSGAADRG